MRARRTPIAASADTMSLSRLDVISCGLGGAVFLGLILSVVRQDRPSSVSADRFLAIEVWLTASGKANTSAVPNLWVKPPGAAEGLDLPLEFLEPASGRLAIELVPTPGREVLSVAGDEYHLVNMSYVTEHGSVTAPRSVLPSTATTEEHVAFYSLIITNPKAGLWDARVRDHDDRDMHRSFSASYAPLDVRLVGITRDRMEQFNRTVRRFGGLTDASYIRVMP